MAHYANDISHIFVKLIDEYSRHVLQQSKTDSTYFIMGKNMGFLTDSFKNALGMNNQNWTRILDAFKLKYPKIEVSTEHLGRSVPYTFIVWRTPSGKYIVDLYAVTENELNFPRNSSGAFIFPKSLNEISHRTDVVPICWDRFSHEAIVGEIGYFASMTHRIFDEDLGKVLGKELANEVRRDRENHERVRAWESRNV